MIELFDLLQAGNSSNITKSTGKSTDKCWLVSFMNYDLGYFNEDARRVEPIGNPFKARVLARS
ncbi:MAG: hypothetical protein QGG54_20705, partial [Gammaproteobacteria bacterium]|nr:hypothetical protein [Gammaproteobacteria bacterium]